MRVAVIGGGASGLTAAKHAKEAGLLVTVFESRAKIGGLWGGFPPETGTGTWNSLTTNLSKHACVFSDFPHKPEIAEFPDRSTMGDYLKSYARHFGLLPHIKLNTKVARVDKAPANRWKVSWSTSTSLSSESLAGDCGNNSNHGGTITAEEDGHQEAEFDKVVVASGFFSEKHIPHFRGLDEFREAPGNRTLHSSDYREPSAFKERRVLVVGSAFSGAEIAAEIAGATSKIAESVTVTVRRPRWVLPRYIGSGDSAKPIDLAFYSRKAHEATKGLTLEQKYRRTNGNLAKLAADLSHLPEELRGNPSSSEPPLVTISDSFAAAVQQQKLRQVRGTISHFTKQGAVIDTAGSQELVDVDTVLFATGFKLALPFFSADVLQAMSYRADDSFQPLALYHSTLHPAHPSLAFVGLYRGPYLAVMELQARWAAAVFAGQVPYPAENVMLQEIQEELGKRELVPTPQFPQNYVDLCDKIAKELGVLPSPSHPLHEDLFSGPLVGAHYRLLGPGACPSEATAIISSLRNPPTNDHSEEKGDGNLGAPHLSSTHNEGDASDDGKVEEPELQHNRLREFFRGQWDLKRELRKHDGSPIGTVSGRVTLMPLADALIDKELLAGSDIEGDVVDRLAALEALYDSKKPQQEGSSLGDFAFSTALFYHEQCELRLATAPAAPPARTQRSYLYVFRKSHRDDLAGDVEVRFWEPRVDSEHLKFFFSMTLLEPDESGPSESEAKGVVRAACSGSSSHLCIQDLYKVNMAILKEGRFRMSWDITGPAKAYSINNMFSKL